jgi:DNA-binding transcriptional ArsR family regulator
MEHEIRLSGREFRALASETRAGIIKLLRDRNHTMTEISRKLGLSAPTIKEHLGILEGAELVQELDEGRKWKYYRLTPKGRGIFSHEAPVNVFIVLGASIIALAGLVYSFTSMLGISAMDFAARNGIGPAFIEKGWEMDIISAGQASGTLASAQPLADASFSGIAGVPPEMLALLAAIVVVSLLAGFLIAKAAK